ncbi:MAG TPA: hypothetical protein VFD75_15645 [Pyrinomonadaceae bacterium]|nr:hypothetical protein [Pyrinomonadaceae bacterium]
MIRVIMLDGDALIADGKVMPHVPEALDVLTKFEPAARASLVVSLVSDYEMPTTPVTPRKVNTIFRKYVAMLDELRLKEFFEPVELRVTLSTQAGVFKPDARLFKKAIQRLRLRAGLDECLSVGNNAEQVKACRALGMSALLLDDWAQAPLLIARVVSPASAFNLRLALQLPLATTYDVQLVRLDDAQSRNVIHAIGKKLFPVPLKTETIEVPFTVQLDISFDKQGKIRDVKTDQPTAEAIAESADYVETLEANNQISHGEANAKGSSTYELVVDKKGRKVLTRKRFFAS